MKRELTGMAMTILLLGTASCSQSEDGIDIVTPPASKAVTLGVDVGVNTGAKTRAAMTGTAITFKDADYGTTDHAIGLVVSNADVSGYYAAETPGFDIGYTYTAPTTDICFMGDKDGKTGRRSTLRRSRQMLLLKKQRLFTWIRIWARYLPISRTTKPKNESNDHR